MRRLVGPFIQPARDARQDALTARVDEALSAAMRRVLHHPDFQTAEALWRGVEFLVRRIETGAKMEIVLYDVSAEELAADLAANDALEETGLYGMLVEQPALDAHQGPLSADHRALLVRTGAAACRPAGPHRADRRGRRRAPFIAGIAPDALKVPFHDQHPLIKDAFSALQALAGSRLSRPGDAALPAAHAIRPQDRPDRRLRLRGVHPPRRARRACCGATRR